MFNHQDGKFFKEYIFDLIGGGGGYSKSSHAYQMKRYVLEEGGGMGVICIVFYQRMSILLIFNYHMINMYCLTQRIIEFDPWEGCRKNWSRASAEQINWLFSCIFLSSNISSLCFPLWYQLERHSPIRSLLISFYFIT